MSTIRIQTTQNVTLEYEIASVGDRILAAAHRLCASTSCGLWPGALLQPDNYHLSRRRAGRAGAAAAAHHVLHPGLRGVFQWPDAGQKSPHLRVVRLDGTRAGLGDYLLRWLLRPVEIVMTLGVVALITILLNGRGQRLGDLAAGTTVISLQKRRRYARPWPPSRCHRRLPAGIPAGRRAHRPRRGPHPQAAVPRLPSRKTTCCSTRWPTR